MSWTLADIRQKVRNITNRRTESMMTTSVLDMFINQYYVFTMPFELKLQEQYQFYDLYTIPNVDTYDFPFTYNTINPRVWANGYPLVWYTQPELFYQDFPEQDNNEPIETVSSPTSDFNYITQAQPVMRNTVFVSDGLGQVLVDDGFGGFTQVDNNQQVVPGGDGNINYVTGQLEVHFTSLVSAGANVSITYQTYTANRPYGVMLFQRKLTLRPVPDDVYKIRFQGLPTIAPLVQSTDVPFNEEMGPLIAYGASLEIFADIQDEDNYQKTLPRFNRYMNVALGRTHEDELYMRSVPSW